MWHLLAPMEEGDISFNEVTTTSISFSWGMVSADTNGPFDFYLLNLKNESSIDVQNVRVNTSETREHTFSSLMPGSLYRVELIVNSNRRSTAPMYTRKFMPLQKAERVHVPVHIDNEIPYGISGADTGFCEREVLFTLIFD